MKSADKYFSKKLIRIC
uniref:Uncharacterized protein n=1 Tax=Arundo donax TaxID=35708 RepID=A0A0A9A4B1_ARUDO